MRFYGKTAFVNQFEWFTNAVFTMTAFVNHSELKRTTSFHFHFRLLRSSFQRSISALPLHCKFKLSPLQRLFSFSFLSLSLFISLTLSFRFLTRFCHIGGYCSIGFAGFFCSTTATVIVENFRHCLRLRLRLRPRLRPRLRLVPLPLRSPST